MFYYSLLFTLQVWALIPLMYMCICTYYSLFKIGMLMFYSLTPRQTSSVSLLMICSYVFPWRYVIIKSYSKKPWWCLILINNMLLRMVARYAPPISYNFLNLISLDAKTIFETVSPLVVLIYVRVDARMHVYLVIGETESKWSITWYLFNLFTHWTLLSCYLIWYQCPYVGIMYKDT